MIRRGSKRAQPLAERVGRHCDVIIDESLFSNGPAQQPLSAARIEEPWLPHGVPALVAHGYWLHDRS